MWKREQQKEEEQEEVEREAKQRQMMTFTRSVTNSMFIMDAAARGRAEEAGSENVEGVLGDILID